MIVCGPTIFCHPLLLPLTSIGPVAYASMRRQNLLVVLPCPCLEDQRIPKGVVVRNGSVPPSTHPEGKQLVDQVRAKLIALGARDEYPAETHEIERLVM
eukprot:1305267-Prymnesium_polylepis.1